MTLKAAYLENIMGSSYTEVFGDVYPTKYMRKTTGRLKFRLPQNQKDFEPKLMLQVVRLSSIVIIVIDTSLDFMVNSTLKIIRHFSRG